MLVSKLIIGYVFVRIIEEMIRREFFKKQNNE